MSPDHKGETGDGDVSGVKVILDILVDVGISFVYAKWSRSFFEPWGASRGTCTVPRTSILLDENAQTQTPSLKINLNEVQSPIRGPQREGRGRTQAGV